MRICPFCKKEVKFVNPYLLYLEDLNKWAFMHHCNDHTMVMVTAETKEKVFSEWDKAYEEQTSESL
jgi:hypothetical protein